MTEKEILSYITKPFESYVDTNILNMKNLCDRIKREHLIGNDEFEEKILPVITGEIERYYREKYNDKAPLWGAWYKAQDKTNLAWTDIHTTFGCRERNTLARFAGMDNAPGEMIGYALCVFAGLSVTETMNARYRDLTYLSCDSKTMILHTRGAFPKAEKATAYDALPREIPLLGYIKCILEKRLERIENSVSFPVTSEQGTFNCAGDLPIACSGNDYTSFCSIADLSAYARDVLRCGIGFSEISVSYLQNIMLEEPALYAFERSAAYYLGRRDFATMIASCVSEDMMLYLTGHTRGNEDAGKGFDVTCEELKEAKHEYEIHASGYMSLTH